MATKPVKKKSNKKYRHQNNLWDYFSTDQKKVLLNIQKTIDKT